MPKLSTTSIGPFRDSYQPSDHLAVLQKFIYRLAGDLTQPDRERLEKVIATYQRLYVHA